MTFNKSELRKEYLERRLLLPLDNRQELSQKITTQFFTHIQIPTASAIAGYAAIKGEVDCFEILTKLDQQEFLCGLPIVNKGSKTLSFFSWTPEAPLEKGDFSILQPAAKTPMEPTIVIVPLLAFDQYGYRLGYGGGYYDRTLTKLQEKSTILTIGLAYDIQKCDALPIEKTDVQLDFVVTESKVYKFT